MRENKQDTESRKNAETDSSQEVESSQESDTDAMHPAEVEEAPSRETGPETVGHDEAQIGAASGGSTLNPLTELVEMGASESLVQEVKATVDPNEYGDFCSDIKRVVHDATKDVGQAQGDVGEILSYEKGLAGSLVAAEETEHLVTVPAPDNFAKGFDIKSPGGENPEFDKLVVNEKTGEVVEVIEEKTGENDSAKASSAVRQADRNLETVEDEGIDEILNDKHMNDDTVGDLSKEDFEDASVGAIVASGMDDSDEAGHVDPEQVVEYNWTPEEFELMHKIINEVK